MGLASQIRAFRRANLGGLGAVSEAASGEGGEGGSGGGMLSPWEREGAAMRGHGPALCRR